MSILKLIQEAEEKAEILKDEANEEIAALLEKTKEKTTKEVEQMYNDYSLKQKEIDQEYSDLISKKEKEIIDDYLKQDEENEMKTRSTTKETVEFILGKVIET